MVMRTLVIASGLLLFGLMPNRATAGSAQSLREISAQLSTSSLLRGDFAQTKHIEGFRNPLRSAGRFILAREHGVVWDTRTPFPSTMVLSQEQLLSRQSDGSVQVLLSAADSGAMGALHGLLMALIVADFDRLSAQFEIQVLPSTSTSGWALQLQPTDASLQQTFVQIELHGDQFVRQVRMTEAAGDQTQIEFTELQTEPSELSPAEAELFD